MYPIVTFEVRSGEMLQSIWPKPQLAQKASDVFYSPVYISWFNSFVARISTGFAPGELELAQINDS